MEQDGRQAACLGEVVIFTCNLTEATGLQWVAEPFIPQDDPLDFAASATVDAALTDTSGQFRAVLVTIMTRVGGTADFTSELIVTASSIMRTVIQCSSVLLTASVNKTLIPAGTVHALYLEYALTNYHSNPLHPPQSLPLLHSCSSQTILCHCIT